MSSRYRSPRKALALEPPLVPWAWSAAPAAGPACADARRAIAAGAPRSLRLRVFWTRGKLDGQIAAGRRCDSSEQLALRACQLTHLRNRQRLARNLQGVVEHVDWLGSRLDLSAVPIQRAAVRAGRGEILGLAQRLQGARPVNPRGVAVAQMLLTDVASPFYDPECRKTLAQAVWDAVDLLEVGSPAL